MPQPTDELHNLDNPVFGRHLFLSRSLRAQTAKQGFRIQVITLFHQLVQHFLHGSIPARHLLHFHTVTGQLGEIIRRRNGDSFSPKTFKKGVHEETGSVINIDIIFSDRSDIARNSQIIPVRQPIPGKRELSGGGSACSRPVCQSIIRRYGLAGDACRIPLHGRGNYRYPHRSLAEHQRREIGLITCRSIIPCPSMPPVKGIFHRNIPIHLPVNHRKRVTDYFLNQRIHCLAVKLRIESTHHIQVSLQCIMFYHSIVPHFRTERLIGFGTGEGGNGSQQFHSRGGTGQLLRTIVIKRFLSRQVVNGYADFG